MGREYTTMIGSNFPLDRSEEYGYRVLSNIILCMEQGNVLILKSLEGIYGSLYDMLNQSYTIVRNKKHCRIALGPYSNPMCYVHDSFKCVVIVEEDKLPLSDPPFLNRFEKQIFSYEDKMLPSQKTTLAILKTDFQNMCKFADDLDQDFNPQRLSPVLEKDKLSSILASLVIWKQGGACYSEELRQECLRSILPMFHPEAVMVLPFSKFWKGNERIVEDLQRIYYEMLFHNGLQLFLEKSALAIDRGNTEQQKTIPNMYIIFTHSNPLVHISDCLKENTFWMENLSSITSDKEFEARIKKFWTRSNLPLLIIRASSQDDLGNILMTKIIVEKWRKKSLNFSNHKTKHVVMIVHLARNQPNRIGSKIDFSSEWEMVTMDTLEEPIRTLPDMIKKNVSEVLHARKKHLHKVVRDSLYWAFHRIHYLDGSHTRRIGKIVNTIIKTQTIMDAFVSIILEYIDSKEKNTEKGKNGEMKWIIDIAKDKKAISSWHTLTYAVDNFLLEQIKQPLAMLIYKLEEMDALSPLNDPINTERIKIWLKLLNKPNFINLSNIQKPKGPGCYEICRSGRNLKIPFSKVFIDRVASLRESTLENRMEMEDSSDHEDFRQQVMKILQQIPELNEMEYMYEEMKRDYLHDFYKCMFFQNQTYAHNIENFIWIMTQFCTLKGSFMEGTLSEFITKLHHTYWEHSSSIHVVFRLLHIASNNAEQTHISVSNLVKTVCINAVPSKELLRKLDNDLTIWQQDANLILCLSQHVEGSTREIDILKFFIELVDILQPQRFSQYLGDLDSFARLLIKDGSRIDNQDIYQCLLELLQTLNKTPENSKHVTSPTVFNQAIAIYMNRCLSTDQSSRQRICDLLKNLKNPTTIFDTRLTNLGPTLTFCVMEENEDKVFEKLLHAEWQDDVTKPFGDPGTFLEALNSSLSNDQIGPSLKLMLLDILEMHVFGYINEMDIYDFVKDENILFNMVENAFNIATNQETSLNQITGLAFLKVFLRKVATCMEKSLQCPLNFASNKILFNRINAILCYKDTSTVEDRHLAIYFLKCLNGSQGLTGLRSCCSRFEEIEVCEAFLKEDMKIENAYELESRTMFSEENYLNISNSVTDFDEEKFLKIMKSKEQKLIPCLIEVFKSHLFLKRHINSSIPVSIQQNCEKICTLTKKLCDDVEHRLLEICSLVKDADCTFLKEMSLDINTLQLVISVSNVVCAICQYGSKTGFWFDSLKNPRNVAQGFLSYFAKNNDDLTQTDEEQRISTPGNSDHIVCYKSAQVNVSRPADLLHSKTSGQFSPISFHFFQFLINGCLLFSKAMRFIDDREIHAILKYSGSIGAEEYLQKKLQSHWDQLCLLMNIGSGEMTLFVKIVIKEIGTDLFERIPMYDLTMERQNWEARISSHLHKIVEERETLICHHATRCNDLFDINENWYWYHLTKRDEDCSPGGFQDIFTKISSPSVENMFGELCLSQESHPFLKLVIEHYDELKLPQYIPSLIQWHSFMATTSSYHFNKSECDTMSLYELKTKLSNENTEDVLDRHFQNFKKTWDDLLSEHGQILSRIVPAFKALDMDSKVCDCLLLGPYSLIYKVIESFASIQNNLLDSVEKLCEESTSLPISLFKKDEVSTSIPVTSLMETSSKNVFDLLEDDDYDDDYDDKPRKREILIDVMKRFSESSTVSGKRSRIVYNFTKIEFEMAQSLLLNKTYISLETRVPRVQFKDDTFQNTMSLISDVKESVSQIPLPVKFIEKMESRKTSLPLMSLITLSGSIIAHLSQTKGESDKPLIKYIQHWKSVFLQSLEIEQLLASSEQLCLKHAVALYRFTEELVGEVELKKLSNDLKVSLPPSANRLLESRNDMKVFRCLSSAVKVFVYRNLTTDKHNIEKRKCLRDYLKDASFWPEDCIDEQGNLVLAQGEKTSLNNFLPSDIMVQHVGGLAEKLQSLIVEQPQQSRVVQPASQARRQQGETRKRIKKRF